VRDDGSVVETRDRVSGRNRWIVGALVAQLFMVSAFVAVITADAEPALIVTTCILLLIFSGTYVFLVGRLLQASVAARAAVVGLLLLLTLPAFLVLGTSTTSLWVFVAVAGGMLFPFGAAMAIGVVLAVAMLVIDAIAGDPLSWELALTLVALTAFMAGFAANVRLNIELRETREELAVAAVAAERERIGRDLHDILGHSLTAIAVKAGLARRLLASDPAAAGTEIGDVERLAREALKDVRATASGYREVSLTAELGVAAGVLRAAGIRADLPATADDVDPDAREALGYVLREAVTNVVRHSGARTCRVVLHSRSIEIVDDGDGVDRNPTAGTGAGLQNLADRMGAQGGSCEAGPGPDGGFVIRAGLPAAVPGRTGIGSATA
jgi:two-component system, NarL family, sensor histidine kinase DesK